MNIKTIPYKRNCYSIRELEGHDPDIIYQPSQEMHLHQVPKGYQILSKNDFMHVHKRVNVGIFNKKTNFIVGEHKSLLFWDKKEGCIINKDISEILEDQSRYFLFYDMNFIIDDINTKIEILDKTTGEKIDLILNGAFGNDVGVFLRKADPQTDIIPAELQILKAIIQIDSGRLSINKQILINSNPEFLLGILEGYIQKENQLVLKNNLNIYNITYILNLLGAQYSIRSLQSGEKQVRFRLPQFLRKMTTLRDNFFRYYKYKFKESEESEESSEKMKVVLTKGENYDPALGSPEDTTLFNLVNVGLIELIPVKDLVFIPIEDQTMYDLSMTNANATNYCLPGSFYTDNSDGDILGAVAIFTKDAAEECIRKFSVEQKNPPGS